MNIEKEPLRQLIRQMVREEWERIRREGNHIHPVAESGRAAPPHRAVFGSPQPAPKKKGRNRRKPTEKNTPLIPDLLVDPPPYFPGHDCY
ncbi:hypothetical protein SAMN04488112_11534 [Melghirimyces thermohalophilus]|uniref:Uncharacterized protein n=1 Tax=Melghirimyces thermohalophilus TaxID=1236220 RepID=A0A1G6P3V8_9BACL|nr:hypothetical protein [Melghirimyces thermohalophilus]SDC74186.1 hypothetical protein SAMN04488112_11534 [Melghirimyces thermohalophilus]